MRKGVLGIIFVIVLFCMYSYSQNYSKVIKVTIKTNGSDHITYYWMYMKNDKCVIKEIEEN